MSIGIVRYPGSNCDFDTLNYFRKFLCPLGCYFLWHTETEFPEHMKLLVIPGGFAFGDRLYDKATGKYTISPGTMAIESPVTKIIKEAAKRKIRILGICNGFQILTQLGLLPGELVINYDEKFVCRQVHCKGLFKMRYKTMGYDTSLYIANSYGKYWCSKDEYVCLKENNQIFLKYKNDIPEIGSLDNIAGVCNKDRNIFGMMPHPERNNSDFKAVLEDILFSPPWKADIQSVFQTQISKVMHSEHVSYKSTKKYLKKLYTEGDHVVQGPGENAGIVDIGDGYCIALRIESHNHPTFIDPFEGAATGVGGILRDIFTMGARPIAILDFLRFGTSFYEYCRVQREFATDGISYYGNCVGVPNVGGDLYVHESYDKNPLVNVGCIGIVKKENIICGRATDYNQLLIYVGSKTGNEGIGGAVMASNSFHIEQNMESLKKNVQKSDPFLEKLLLEACCEIAEKKLAIGMQDMGAGGLLCASYEVVKRGREKTGKNLGFALHLEAVPTKYEMEPINILISESQERMLIVTDERRSKEIFEIFKKWDLEYSVIGSTNSSGKYFIYDDSGLLYEEEMDDRYEISKDWPVKPSDEGYVRPNVCKAEKIKNMKLWEVYDSTVGNRTIKGPDMDGSYAILDIPEVNKKLFLTWGETFDECIIEQNYLGSKPLCLVNCLNFGHPKDCMTDFIRVVEDLSEKCQANKIPIVGGNVSLYNETGGKPIRPTPIFLMMGIS
jgi:phosphoribosylformylglycinamidine synthase